jgi:hypothetical protein
MEEASTFSVLPTDDAGTGVGEPLFAAAGWDDRSSNGDDGFIGRFVVRRIAVHCRGKGDCTGATFKAEALVPWRNALDPESRARMLPRPPGLNSTGRTILPVASGCPPERPSARFGTERSAVQIRAPR